MGEISVKSLFYELVGKPVTIITDTDAVSDVETQFRDEGALDAFDGLVLRLQKFGTDHFYFFADTIQRALVADYELPVPPPKPPSLQPGELLNDLLNMPISVWLTSTRHRTDCVLEAWDTTAIRINTGEQVVYFPLSNIRMLKLREAEL
jgi:hypothetical protein